MTRAQVVRMHRQMREMHREMEARVREPNVHDPVAMNMAVQAAEAMRAMERIVAVMDNEPGVVPADMR